MPGSSTSQTVGGIVVVADGVGFAVETGTRARSAWSEWSSTVRGERRRDLPGDRDRVADAEHFAGLDAGQVDEGIDWLTLDRQQRAAIRAACRTAIRRIDARRIVAR